MIIVIGAGLAGYNFAQAFRKLDQETPLTIVTEDDGHFYSKPQLSRALAAKQTPQDILLKSSDTMAAQLDANILTRTVVTAIDTAKKTISLKDQTLAYDHLVLATGSVPVMLPLTENTLQQLHSINHWDSYQQFIDQLQGKQNVAIIGDGLVGCEFANDLLLAGYQVNMFGRGEHVLEGLLPEACAKAVQASLVQHGLDYHSHASVVALHKQGEGCQIQLDNGKAIHADIVLSAIGIRANISLAVDAGIRCDKGIQVDDYLATSASSVYAIGDCMEYQGQVKMYVPPILQQARALAQTLTGTATKINYPHLPASIKTSVCPVTFILPASGLAGAWKIEQNADAVIAKWFDNDDQLKGFVLTGSACDLKAELLQQMT